MCHQAMLIIDIRTPVLLQSVQSVPDASSWANLTSISIGMVPQAVPACCLPQNPFELVLDMANARGTLARVSTFQTPD